MAKIPLYQSSQRLTTEAPQSVRESPHASGQFGRDLQVTGESVSQATEGIRQAYDFQQVGGAKLKTLEGMNALEEKALQDGENTGDFSKYDAEISRIRTEALSGISNPSVKEKFSLDFDLQAGQTRTQLTKIFRKNMVSKGLANLDTLNTYFTNEYATTGDASYIDLKDKQIDAYVKQGFLGADDAEKLKYATTLDAREKSFVFDRVNNPALAKEKLANNAYGFDVEKLAKANEVFDREVKKMQDDNEEAIIADYLNNKPIDRQGIINLMNEGKIDAKFARSFIKDIEDPQKEVKTNEATYDSIINMMLNGKEKASTVRQAIIEARANGLLSATDFRSLYRAKQQGRDMSVIAGYYDEIHKTNPFWKAAIESIRNAAQNIFGGVTSFIPMFRSFIDKVQKKNATPDQLPNLALQTIKEKMIEENPSIANLKDVPNAKFDKGGMKTLLEGNNEAESQFTYQNGRIVPVKKKE